VAFIRDLDAVVLCLLQMASDVMRELREKEKKKKKTEWEN
jgi:hypothetical protein